MCTVWLREFCLICSKHCGLDAFWGRDEMLFWGMGCFLGAECVFWGLSVFSGGCSNAGGTLSAPRNWKSLYVVGSEIWTFALSAPRN